MGAEVYFFGIIGLLFIILTALAIRDLGRQPD